MLKRPALLALALLAAAAVLSAPPGGAQKGPIKVGLLVPLTGPLSANGKDMVNGLELFLEEQKSRLAGREIRLIVEDDEGKPATGLTKVRGLVEGQGVHVVVGPLSAAVGYAVAPYIDGTKVPAIYPIVSAEDITQRKRSPYIVRVGWSSAQPSHPFGRWVYDNLKYRRIAMIGYDFAFGWEVAAGFHRTFEEAGGQVVQKLWPPLNTPDFAPYLAQLRRDVDAIYAVFSGADALRFAKQYAEAGLKERLPLIGGGTFTDEHVLRPTAASSPPTRRGTGRCRPTTRRGPTWPAWRSRGRWRPPAARSRTPRSSWPPCGGSSSPTRRGARSGWTSTATRSRTSTSAGSRRWTAGCRTR
jgi:branched-chain amino acid transport system substrate-binding protein